MEGESGQSVSCNCGLCSMQRWHKVHAFVTNIVRCLRRRILGTDCSKANVTAIVLSAVSGDNHDPIAGPIRDDFRFTGSGQSRPNIKLWLK